MHFLPRHGSGFSSQQLKQDYFCLVELWYQTRLKKMGTRKYSDIFGNCLTREGEEVQENISNLIKNFLGMGCEKEQEHVQNFQELLGNGR